MLRGRDRVGVRGVDHHHPGLGGGVDVDVVDSDPGSTDDLELWCRGDHPRIHRRGRADDEPGGVGEPAQQIVPADTGCHVDLDRSGERIDGGSGDGFGDDDDGSAHGPSTRNPAA